MDMKELYQRRAAEFTKEIRPYIHYALQSVVIASVMAFLVLSIGYKQFLQWVTPEFPWRLAAATFLLPSLAGGRIRTYLQEADTLFLLPQERGMGIYMESAQRKAMMLQSAAVIASWLIVWPLYSKITGAGALSFLVLLIVWVLFKKVLLYGKWSELQLQEQSARTSWAFLRWVWAGSAAYALFSLGIGYGILIISLGSIAYIGGLQLPRKYIVHWSLFIDLEQRHRASIYRYLNWFIDVPALRGKARKSYGLDRLARFIPFHRRFSYHYLYSLVLLRSELLGITVRLSILGIILVAIMSVDWLRIVVYLLFSLFSALQLADLKRYYREHLWQRIYPLPEKQRALSVGKVRLTVHLTVLILLTIPLAATLSAPIWAAALLIITAGCSFLYHRFR